MNKVRVICIDDSNRPKEIPLSRWVKKDSEYTIVHIFWHVTHKIQGVELAEIELDNSCFPYVAFSLARFAIFKEDLDKFVAMLKDCTDLNDVDISNLIEELNFETA